MDGQILVIDEGTTSTRAMLFALDGTPNGSAQRSLKQYYPAPGLVEHNAEEIWHNTLVCAREMVKKAGSATSIVAIGITNQRETIVFWDRRTGKPLAPAIVWQDRRTAGACSALKRAGHEPLVQAHTGLLLDPYFSASKIRWALDNWPQLEEAGDYLAVGTVESYLVYRLTLRDNEGTHVTDASNASRTALMNITTGKWDAELCNMFGVPQHILPRIVDCTGDIGITATNLLGGKIAICGMAGDQQAATIGQACLAPGQTKATYGTGAFVLTNSGSTMRRSGHRLLSTILYQIEGKRTYALEGSVFVAGSLIQWLRDEMQLLETAEQTEEMARSVPDNGGVYLVPALSGLGAPHWQSEARAAITGLSFASTRAHIARAALEAMAYQTHDLKSAYAADDADWAELRVDGGMSSNDWIAQDLADMLNVRVERPEFTETTALGAAMLAGVGCGHYSDLQAASVMRGKTTGFSPILDAQMRSARLAGWEKALCCALN